jgi:glycolate oxidase iron-sulfur subunit
MRTEFSEAQKQDPVIAEANQILRTCVHCGFCTATCPTYVLKGDELDSPRGRIYLIKSMLESGEAATAETVKHIDRCLSCLACMTTCPSGVHYMHLIDQARAHVERTYRRPMKDRLLRAGFAAVMPRPGLFRALMSLARMARPLAPLLAKLGQHEMASGLALVPARLPATPARPAAPERPRGRIALLRGCVQSVLDPGINAAAERLLTRLGYEIVEVPEEGCCGSLNHHLGKEGAALRDVRRMVDRWTGLDVEAIIVTASGCGTTIKDYGHMLRLDPAYAARAAAVSAKARDVTEFLEGLDLPEGKGGLKVAYHSACSLQHGQKIKTLPQALLTRAGFTVLAVPEGHLCCGSAGTYNILQPEIAAALKARKVANIEGLSPDVIAAGNIGCLTQIGSGTELPILHTVELLDWAYGGPLPRALQGRNIPNHLEDGTSVRHKTGIKRSPET